MWYECLHVEVLAFTMTFQEECLGWITWGERKARLLQREVVPGVSRQKWPGHPRSFHSSSQECSPATSTGQAATQGFEEAKQKANSVYAHRDNGRIELLSRNCHHCHHCHLSFRNSETSAETIETSAACLHRRFSSPDIAYLIWLRIKARDLTQDTTSRTVSHTVPGLKQCSLCVPMSGLRPRLRRQASEGCSWPLGAVHSRA